MAEPRYKIKGIGLPFEAQYSSCSNLKPQQFDWSIQDGDYEVHIDNGLFIQPNHSFPKQKRYGWVCESRFIVPNVYHFLIQNHKILFDNFYEKIFTCDSQLLELNSKFEYVQNGSNYPWIPLNEWKIYTKSKTCSMFASPKLMTEGHVYRHEIAKQAIDLGYDVFGGAHGTKRTVTDPRNPWLTKGDGLRDYMFSIIIENGNYDSYYTEKLTDCFATGTIPVYWGTKKLPDIFDKDGIIFLEEEKEKEILFNLTKEFYDSKKEAIKNNFNALQLLKLADDQLFGKICHR